MYGIFCGISPKHRDPGQIHRDEFELLMKNPEMHFAASLVKEGPELKTEVIRGDLKGHHVVSSSVQCHYQSLETNIFAPKNGWVSNRNLLFQGSIFIFRGEVMLVSGRVMMSRKFWQ